MRKFFLTLTLLALAALTALPAAAQDQDSTLPNRANAYTFAEYVRNHNMLELLRVLNDEGDVAYNPFGAEGGTTPMDELIAGEVELNAALDFDFTRYLILAEGDQTALIGYQEADFTGEIYDTPPNGQHYSGLLFIVTQYRDGKAIRDLESWNNIDFMQFMGWLPADYTFTPGPWEVKLGSSSTPAAEQHQTVQALWDAMSGGDTGAVAAAIADAYAPDAVTHDYLQDLSGAEPIGAFYGAIAALPGFTLEQSGIVCEGDLCATATTFSVTATDPADEDGKTYMVWANLQRFVDGKIAEDWLLYDNSSLWAFLPPAA